MAGKVFMACALAWQRATGWRPDWEWYKVFFGLLPAVAIGPAFTSSVFVLASAVPFVIAELGERGEANFHPYWVTTLCAFVGISIMGAWLGTHDVKSGKRSYENALQAFWTQSMFRLARKLVPVKAK